MKQSAAVAAALIASLWLVTASAAIDVLEFDDASQEARYNDLIKELRCLVCQNQNLADSDADLAKDLRNKAYEMVRAGNSDQDIVDYMVDRYGDFVLYRPPLNTSTVLLWVGPFVILVTCLMILIVIARRRRGRTVADMDDEQRRKAERLLRDQD